MRKPLIRIAAVAGAAPSLAPGVAWAQAWSDADRWAHGPGMMWWGGGWSMIFGPLFMILVLAVVIALAVLLVRWLGGSWQGQQPPDRAPPGRAALDVLKERFARGEIDKAEFEERRRVLGE